MAVLPAAPFPLPPETVRVGSLHGQAFEVHASKASLKLKTLSAARKTIIAVSCTTVRKVAFKF